jgi:galactose mutarotase-like enzyme
MAAGGRGLPLLPWPNRLADGRYTFEGVHHQVPIDEVGRENAIHGLTRSLNWNVVEQTTDRVRVGLTIYPRPGYPFALELSIDYSLGATGLTVRAMAHNAGRRALPFGAGWHPYMTVGTALVDLAVLHVPAQSRLELDTQRRLPTGTVSSVDGSPGEYDFRMPRAIGTLVLDDCYTALDRTPDGLARVTLSDPITERGVSVWMDGDYRYVQIFSGDTLAAADRRLSLAIEPMTCPPNAFRTGTDLMVIQPGETRSLAWGVARTR